MAMDSERLANAMADKLEEKFENDNPDKSLTPEQKADIVANMRAFAEAIVEEIETYYEPPS